MAYNTSPEDDRDKFAGVEANKTFAANEGFLFPNFTPPKLFVYQGLVDDDDWDSPYYSDEDDPDDQYHSDEGEEGEDDSDGTDSDDSGSPGGSDEHDEDEDEHEEGSDEYNSDEEDDENEVEDDSDEDQDEDTYECSEKQHYPSLNTATNEKKSFWQKLYRKPVGPINYYRWGLF